MQKQLPKTGICLVELYDREHLRNLISLLHGSYSDVVYVYFRRANEPDRRDKKILDAFISRRFGFSPRFLEIPENSVECALEHFRGLLASGGFYDFDITGGFPVFIAAAGALWAECGGNGMALHQYNTAAGRCVTRCPADLPMPLRSEPASLSVEEVLALRGISLMNREESVRSPADRSLLKGEVHRLWEAVRGELRAWNSFCTKSADVTYTENGIRTAKRVSPHEAGNCRTIIAALENAGILADLNERDDGSRIRFSYRLQIPSSALFLYEKAGNLLEMLTYLALEENEIFTDCRTGVKLDWESSPSDGKYNPFNEIDAIATMGHIPCFISCKNTGVENEYLYEILTMTRHFGGLYAIPALVTSMDCHRALLVRAQEMGIVLIDNIARMTAGEFSRTLGRELRNLRRSER